jgi:transposase-like protein
MEKAANKGKREVLGVQVSLSEAEVYWREFLGDSQKRGMHGTKLIISDAHSGIKAVNSPERQVLHACLCHQYRVQLTRHSL